MTDLKSIEDRAQRMLDGMTVNREAFARDVLKLCAAARQVAAAKQPEAKPTAAPFDGFFGDIFGGRGHG